MGWHQMQVKSLTALKQASLSFIPNSQRSESIVKICKWLRNSVLLLLRSPPFFFSAAPHGADWNLP